MSPAIPSSPVYTIDAATLDFLPPDLRDAMAVLFDEQEQARAKERQARDLAYQEGLANFLLSSGRGWKEVVPGDEDTEECSLLAEVEGSPDELELGPVWGVNGDGTLLRDEPPTLTLSRFYRDLYGFRPKDGCSPDLFGCEYHRILVNHRDREHPYQLYEDVPSLVAAVRDETSFIYMGSFWVPPNGFLTAKRNAMTTINGFCVDIDRVEDEKGLYYQPTWVMGTLLEKLDEFPQLMPNYLMLSGTGIQLWYVFCRRIPLLSAKKRRLPNGETLNASPRRDKFQRVLRSLYEFFDRELPKNRFHVDVPCSTIGHPFRAPASPSKQLYPTRLFVLGGWGRKPADPLALSEFLGCDLKPYDVEEWDQKAHEKRLAEARDGGLLTRNSPATEKQVSWLGKLADMGCIEEPPESLTVEEADALIKKGEVAFTRRKQRKAGGGVIETTSGHRIPTRPRDPGLYSYTLRRISEETPPGSRYNALFGLAGLGWNCGIPKSRVRHDMEKLLDTEWARMTGHDGKPLGESDVKDALSGWNELGALRPREQLEHRLKWNYGPSAKRNGRSREEHLAKVARPVRKAYLEAGRTDVSGGGRPTKEAEIKAYAAAHPKANHSEIARALGVSRPTVIKWLRDRGVED